MCVCVEVAYANLPAWAMPTFRTNDSKGSIVDLNVRVPFFAQGMVSGATVYWATGCFVLKPYCF